MEEEKKDSENRDEEIVVEKIAEEKVDEEVSKENNLESVNEEEEKKDNQKKAQNKQLKNILMIFGGLLVIFLLGFALVDSVRHFEYNGLKFNVVKEQDLIFYNVAFPIYSSITGNPIANYNIYLRKDPRELDAIPIKGGMVLREDLVIEMKDEFKCDGDGIIALANFVKSFKLIGTEVIKDPEAGCDEERRYVHMTIQPGNETSIDQTGPACYIMEIKDCEILEGTEKFIVEAFTKFDKKIYTELESE
jgi:hypothetical protein